MLVCVTQCTGVVCRHMEGVGRVGGGGEGSRDCGGTCQGYRLRVCQLMLGHDDTRHR